MKHVYRIAIAALAATVCSTAFADEKAFMTINGTPISQATAAMYADHLRANGVTDPGTLQTQVREEIVRRETLAEAAHKAGIDKKPAVAAEADAAYRKALAEADALKQTIIIRRYVEDFLTTHPVDDTQLRAVYNRMRSAGSGLEYKVHEVVVKNEADADAIVRKLKGGDKFQDALKGTGTPAASYNGADRGWTNPGQYIKPVAAAMQTMKRGSVTDPAISADDGYHILQVDETRPLKVPSFEEMKPMLVKQAQQEQITRLIDDLRHSAVVR